MTQEHVMPLKEILYDFHACSEHMSRSVILVPVKLLYRDWGL